MKDKVYRIGDQVGPDYKCSKCKVHGLRLWRQTNTMESCLELMCAECATRDQAEAIERYPWQKHPNSNSIGNLVPARPAPDGGIWGHTSGGVTWWMNLPQYCDDPRRELAIVTAERNFYVLQHQSELRRYLNERGMGSKPEDEL